MGQKEEAEPVQNFNLLYVQKDSSLAYHLESYIRKIFANSFLALTFLVPG